MAGELNGISVAVLATDGVEQVELTKPLKALKDAGAQAMVVSPKHGTLKGWNHFDKGDDIAVDVPLEQANPDRFQALVLPGGVANPDQLRMQPKAVEFVRHFVQAGKPIAAICHGPWTLINAGGVKGHRMTSWPSLQADLRNAGAEWVDEPMVRDGKLVTSRNPGDIPAFNKGMIGLFAEAR